MQDVAELAGVSLQTVSNFVNDRHDQMNEQTLAKVSKAMEKLNYRPNVAAASLRSQRTKTIAYLILDQNSAFLEDPLTSQHLAGVAEVADRRGYAILVQSGRPNQIDEESLAPLLEGRFDGAIIQLSGKPKLRKKSAEMALSSGLPSVILDEVGLSPGQLGVRADQEQGAFEITQHLINLGHVRIGFIATAAPWAVIEQTDLSCSLEPTGEMPLHFGLQKEMGQHTGEVRVVVHVHPTYCIAAMHAGIDFATVSDSFPELNRNTKRKTILFCLFRLEFVGFRLR